MTAYGALMRTPRMARLYLAAIFARLPIGINGIALVLFLRAEGASFGVAGAAAGALALGAAVGAPVAARLIDRYGVRVMLVLAGAHAGGLAVLIALGLADAPAPAIVAAAWLTGCALPPISSVLRAGYPRLLSGRADLVQSAFALDSVLTEIIFIGGPLLTALLVWLVSAGAALAASALSVVGGTIWFLASLPHGAVAEARRREGGGRDWAGALRSPGMRTLVVAMLPVGFAFGAIEVALPAFAYSEGNRHLAGVLIAIWALGSAAGGFVYGARPRRRELAHLHLIVAALLPAVFALLALATSPLVMALLLIPAGLPIAPLIATRNELAGRVAPPGSETEAYTWPLTALVSGVALGAAVSGALSDGPGWRAAVLVAAGTAAAGALIAVVRRETLAPDGEAGAAIAVEAQRA
ncbi:MAG: MFS transporter [Thermoleophilaceae bacterium]